MLEGEGGVARSELAELEGKYGVASSQLAELQGQYERITLEYQRMASLCQTLQSKVCVCVVFVEVVVSRGVCAIKGCVCVAVVSTACA